MHKFTNFQTQDEQLKATYWKNRMANFDKLRKFMHDARLLPAVQLENTRTVLETRQIIDDASLEAARLSQALVDNNSKIHGDIKRILQRKNEIDNAGNFT